jgi:phospholipid/cholesterol/gamma-HCH transport system ATP-binding protein
MMAINALELKSVRKSFGLGHEVLKGIDIAVPKGKITVIIGFSGAGKSVMLKHMLGLLTPDQGQVLAFGRDVATMKDEEKSELRRKFGMLFQMAALFDDMTAMENVCFPLKEFRREAKLAERESIAAEKLKQVGLSSEHFKKFPAELSGGMRKRVGLARAIALEPDVIFYDEPTTGLDPIVTEMVDDLILNTHKFMQDRTSVIVSHDLHAAFRLGDYIAMLDAGRIVEFGPPKVFLESKDPLISKFVSKGVHKK